MPTPVTRASAASALIRRRPRQLHHPLPGDRHRRRRQHLRLLGRARSPTGRTRGRPPSPPSPPPTPPRPPTTIRRGSGERRRQAQPSASTRPSAPPTAPPPTWPLPAPPPSSPRLAFPSRSPTTPLPPSAPPPPTPPVTPRPAPPARSPMSRTRPSPSRLPSLPPTQAYQDFRHVLGSSKPNQPPAGVGGKVSPRSNQLPSLRNEPPRCRRTIRVAATPRCSPIGPLGRS
jgi:hypothetical protein